MAYDVSTVAAAMNQKILQLEHVSSNLANAATPGFKSRHLYLLNVLEEESKAGETTAPLTDIIVDFSQGIAQKTDNPLDITIQGDGFFSIQTPEGEAYTRKGDFAINGNGQMVTQAGDAVLGEGGVLVLGNGKPHINEDGSVLVDGNQIGKLRIVDFTNRQALRITGNGLYYDDGEAGLKPVSKPHLSTTSIELSNVNVITEMADMITIHRTFETYQKIIQQLSEQDKLATTRIGRV